MTTTANDVDYKSAPEDYAALYRIYFPYMVNLVAKNGINENNKEDVASEIFLRFMERGFLELFNPDLVFEYEGQKRPAKFKSFLSRAVTTYVRGHCDKQRRQSQREVQICDAQMNTPGTSVGSSNGGGEKLSWADLYGTPTDDHAEKVMDLIVEQQDHQAIRDYLATVPPRSSHDLCNLVDVFDAVRAQILGYGEYDVKTLQVRFGVSTTTMHNWLWWLKDNIAHVYGREVPPKRRRTLHPKAES